MCPQAKGFSHQNQSDRRRFAFAFKPKVLMFVSNQLFMVTWFLFLKNSLLYVSTPLDLEISCSISRRLKKSTGFQSSYLPLFPFYLCEFGFIWFVLLLDQCNIYPFLPPVECPFCCIFKFTVKISQRKTSEIAPL